MFQTGVSLRTAVGGWELCTGDTQTVVLSISFSFNYPLGKNRQALLSIAILDSVKVEPLAARVST